MEKLTEEYVMNIYKEGYKDCYRGVIQPKTNNDILHQMFYFNGVLDAIMHQISFNNQTTTIDLYDSGCLTGDYKLMKYGNYFKYIELLEKTKHINGFSIEKQIK